MEIAAKTLTRWSEIQAVREARLVIPRAAFGRMDTENLP